MRIDGMRPLVEAVERDVACIAEHPRDGDGVALQRSWARLVEFLALGPAPELRACPHCQAVGVRGATRCAACWRRIEPLLPISIPADGARAW